MEMVLVGGHFDGKVVDVNPLLEVLRMLLPPKPCVMSAENAAPPTGDALYMSFVEYRLFKCRDNTYIYKALQE